VDFAINLDKHTHERGERFIGQDVLEQTAAAGGPERKLIGIAIEGKRTARQGMAVQADGREIGAVTSGCLSPTLGHGIGMALVDRAFAEPGKAVAIDTGRGVLEGMTAALPFYKAPKAG
jgi:aminomethyltransferase